MSFNTVATRRLEKSLDKWVANNGTLHAMLKLPEENFQLKRTELLEALNATLHEFKTKLVMRLKTSIQHDSHGGSCG